MGNGDYEYGSPNPTFRGKSWCPQTKVVTRHKDKLYAGCVRNEVAGWCIFQQKYTNIGELCEDVEFWF